MNNISHNINEASIDQAKYIGQPVSFYYTGKDPEVKRDLNTLYDAGISKDDVYTVLAHKKNPNGTDILIGTKPTFEVSVKSKSGEIFNVVGSLSRIKKTIKASAEGGIEIKAEHYEQGIVYMYNTLVMGMSHDDAIIKGKLDAEGWDAIEPYVSEIGEKVALGLPKQGVLMHSGSDNVKAVDWVSKDGTPKTDIYSTEKRISLKKAGGSQLMSGTTESVGVFNAALSYYQYHDKHILEDQLQNVINGVKEKFVSLKISDGIGKMKKDATNAWIDYRVPQILDRAKITLSDMKPTPKKFQEAVEKHAKAEMVDAGIADVSSQYKNWYIKGIDDGQTEFNKWWNTMFLKSLSTDQKGVMENVLTATLDHRLLQEQLRDIFEKNPEYLKWVVYEAATGVRKFTGQIEKLAHQVTEMPVATSIVVFSDSGVTDDDTFTPEWAKGYAGHVKAVVGFKSANKSAMSSFRLLANEEVEELSYLEKVVNEEYQKFVNELEMVNEGFKDVVGKIKTFTKDAWNKFEQAVRSFYENVLKRLVQKLNELLKQGVEVFISAFGLSMNGKAEVSISF